MRESRRRRSLGIGISFRRNAQSNQILCSLLDMNNVSASLSNFIRPGTVSIDHMESEARTIEDRKLLFVRR